MKLNEIAVTAVAVISLFSSVHAEEATLHKFGDYQMKLYSDGSGSFGRPAELDVFGNHWSFQYKKDGMTDETVITLHRTGVIEIAGRKLSAPLGLFIQLSQPSMELVCVLGHDYPGRTAMMRVDKNKPVETNDKACTKLTKEIDEQLREGKTAKVRGVEFPNDWSKDFDVNIDGYAAITDYLRSKREEMRKK